MPQPFLREVADHIYRHHANGDVVLVFPNRRSVFFFRKHLSEMIDRPLLMPESFTISELFSRITGYIVPETLPLLFRLYDAYQQVFENHAETIDEFIAWGETLLHDFDDTDKYLVDAGQLFRNLTDIKEIEQLFQPEEDPYQGVKAFWKHLISARNSDEKEKFLAFWNKLHPLYLRFRENLTAAGIAYEGMNSREAIAKLKTSGIETFLPGHYCFTGFNALNACERELFRILKAEGKASFYWDTDPWYMDNTWHEAGFFLRKNRKEFPSPDDFMPHSDFATSRPEVQITGLPSYTGLAASAGRSASAMLEGSNTPLSTAIVLADENLLIPLLQTLPEQCNAYNVSIGFPVRESQVYTFLFQWLELQKNGKDHKGKPCYYYRHVLSLLHHPLLDSLKDEKKEALEKITTLKMIRVPAELLCQTSRMKTIFTPVADMRTLPSRLRDILVQFYRENISGEAANPLRTIECETILTVYLALQHLEDLLPETAGTLLPETYMRMLRNVLQNLHVPLSGEPLQGLQILGLLETRNLDFENVIILPVNEGVLPRTSQPSSFIPQNLRYGFGMPTAEHQDAVYAYYFYRLLQRARKAEILWNTSASGPDSGKMSRFAYQLLYEQPCQVSVNTVRMNVRFQSPRPIVIEKGPEVLQRLSLFTSRDGSRFSPSALADYIQCPLLFFFRYIARVKPEEELTEEPDAGIFGTLFHETMRKLYGSFRHQLITEEILASVSPEQIQNAVDHALRQHVYKHIPDDQPVEPEGQFIIIRNVLKEYALKVLETDRTFCPYTLTGLEQSLAGFVELPGNRPVKGFMLGGNADRIISHDGKTIIIDYKTGGRKETITGLDMLFTSEHGKDLRYAFQIFFYCYLYSLANEGSVVQPAVYFLREMFNETFDPSIGIKEPGTKSNETPVSDFSPFMHEFEEKLRRLLLEIYEPSLPFTQTSRQKLCQFCSFREVCRRT